MIAIIDYEGGNLTSVKRAVNFLGFDAEITQDFNVIDKADRIIFPGVGAAGASMEVLRKTGLDEIVKDQVINQKNLSWQFASASKFFLIIAKKTKLNALAS